MGRSLPGQTSLCRGGSRTWINLSFGGMIQGGLHDIRTMFEGATRIAEWAPPNWWWAGWCVVAVGFAVFRQWSPRYFVHLGWAWTDYRLLLQSRGDFTAPWYSGWVQNSMAGFAVSLGLSGMLAQSQRMDLTVDGVFRLFFLWWVLMAIRWCAARIWEGISSGEVVGREWAMGHRYVLESTAWALAPVGLFMTIWGYEPSHFGLWAAGAVWAIGWLMRHRRSFERIPRLQRFPVEGFFYLCALEFLPIAVLIRAWQW